MENSRESHEKCKWVKNTVSVFAPELTQTKEWKTHRIKNWKSTFSCSFTMKLIKISHTQASKSRVRGNNIEKEKKKKIPPEKDIKVQLRKSQPWSWNWIHKTRLGLCTYILTAHDGARANTLYIHESRKKNREQRRKKGGAARMAKPKVKITKRSRRKTRNLSDEWARTKVKLNSEQEPVQANISSIWWILSSSLLFWKFTITDFYDVRYHLHSHEQNKKCWFWKIFNDLCLCIGLSLFLDTSDIQKSFTLLFTWDQNLWAHEQSVTIESVSSESSDYIMKIPLIIDPSHVFLWFSLFTL